MPVDRLSGFDRFNRDDVGETAVVDETSFLRPFERPCRKLTRSGISVPAEKRESSIWRSVCMSMKKKVEGLCDSAERGPVPSGMQEVREV